MRVVPSVLALLSAFPVFGLEQLWHCQLSQGARAIPLVGDVMGDSRPEIVVTTRFDGAVWLIGADGKIVGRYPREQWLEGSAAAAVRTKSRAALVAYQESGGRLNLSNFSRGTNRSVLLEGEPRIGTAPVFADLDANGTIEIVCARRNGIVTACNEELRPLWQFQAGASIDASPAVAPVFNEGAAVYIQALDGAVHCLRGDGRPLWRFTTAYPAPEFPSVADPLVAPLSGGQSVVLISDRKGWLYALNAVDGQERWRVQSGTGALGNPALFDVDSDGQIEIITLSEKGELAIVTAAGRLVKSATLPKAAYVPRPLVGDVDGDGQPEMIVAVQAWKVLVVALDGTTKEEVALQGNVREGIVMAEITPDGFLELIAATDCGDVYCFATEAKTAWCHPRADSTLDGSLSLEPQPAPSPIPGHARRDARPESAIIPNFIKESPLCTAVIRFKNLPRDHYASAVIRQHDVVRGAASSALDEGTLRVPFVSSSPEPLVLDTVLYTADGDVYGMAQDRALRVHDTRPVDLGSPEALVSALADRANAFRLPQSWELPKVNGRDSWHVVRYMPEAWDNFGVGKEPFIAEAIPRIASSAANPKSLFSLGHPVWDVLAHEPKPFFIMNDYFRPEAPYPKETYDAIVAQMGERFLGFPVHEWDYQVWKGILEPADPPPANRDAATAILQEEFEKLLEMCHGRMYPGQGYGLFHHHAFKWGAGLGYAEIGENIPCAPLQFAFLRGASRQFGGRPWGAYLSNWFRGTVVDTRLFPDQPRVRWAPGEEMASGPDCGHSPSLEFRMEMAAHLSGATFVHHESDAHNGSILIAETEPGKFQLSPYGQNLRTWYEFAQKYPERGVPFTPVAFLVDFQHGWRPREKVYGVWPPQRRDRSLEAVFGHVFPWGGRLDFERGYLPNGPYGDIFDVITNDATEETLKQYPVLWPIGKVSISDELKQALVRYVEAGGILILDSVGAEEFSSDFLGVRFRKSLDFACQIQTALQAVAPLRTPYRYRPMLVSLSSQTLAWTEDGDPILAWRRNGKGVLLVTATQYWTDERDRLLPLFGAILRQVTDAFLPVTPPGNVQFLLNRTSTGWVIGLINNDGITKVPTEPAVTDINEIRDCLLRFKDRDRAPLTFTSRMGDFRWNVPANALQTRLQPGGVAVVEVVFSGN
ncbi:MAG: PQQ-binding-like beta-propeller repeat protein [Candidatus Hydrogenedentes bacterium]|nr:PQQ-binding-like beta-propeller repeat protein [Candidatus Hydrogenedentota bacterium]